MAVGIIETDGWIQHLEFVGGQRQTPYGPVDGIFYGLMSGTGESGGGNFTMSGRLSEERKEDWVYIFGGSHTRVNSSSVAGDVFEQINTGPLIPTLTAVTNPTFEYGGVADPISGNAIGISPNAGLSKISGMPIFGDKRIPGIFLMYAAGWQNNVEAVVYSAQIWGWLVRYEGFFRNVRPSVG